MAKKNQIGLDADKAKKTIRKTEFVIGKLPAVLHQCTWLSLEHNR